MKASEFLAAARDEIEGGWTQGTLQDLAGNVCAVGAIKRVAEQNKPQKLDDFAAVCEAGNGAATALEMLAQEFGSSSIMSFNDTRRSKDDVLAWFDKAICGLEERGE
jgi:hypothetical protein